MNPRHRFTLLELMAVIMIISLLMAMLLPAMSRGRRSAKTAVCASNLHEIHMVATELASETAFGNSESFTVPEWSCDIMKELRGGSGILRCPEGGSTISMSTSYTIAVDRARRDPIVILRTISLSPGPRSRIRSTLPDGYVLEIEDASDFDYNDLVVEVRFGPGKVYITPLSSSAGYHFHIVNSRLEVVGRDLKYHLGETYELSELTGSNYGMNSGLDTLLVAKRSPNRVLLIDYEKPMVEVTGPDPADDWDSYITGGRYSFARHVGYRMNVAFMDGSVRNKYAHEIDPGIAPNKNRYWSTDIDEDE